jgi:hypothetical protein
MVLMYWFPGIALWLPETLFAELKIIMINIFSLSTNELVAQNTRRSNFFSRSLQSLFRKNKNLKKM